MRKNWRGEDELLLKNGTLDGYACEPCYFRAGYTLRVAPGTLEIFATSSCQIQVKTKKVSPSKLVALRTVPYGKFGTGYCITFIKRLNEV